MQIKKSYVNNNEIRNQEELLTLDVISPIFAILAALTLPTAVVATSIITANSAFAIGGPKAERNNGQCKQDFNSNVCKKFHTGSG
jgi:hypothetical protein